MRSRTLATVLAAAFASLIYLVVLGWPANEFVHDDFVGFWVGSRMLLDGADPYDAQTFAAMHTALGSHGLAMNVAGVGYGYPLTTALVFAPFALLPFAVAAPLWLVMQIVLAGAGLVFLARELFRETLSRDRPVLLALMTAAQPVWVLAASGNLGGFLLAIAATASTLLLRGQAFTAGAVAGLLVVKPHPLLVALVLVAVALPRRDALRATAGAVVTGGILTLASLALRPGWPAEFLISLRGLAEAPVARASIFGVMRSLGPLAWFVAAGLVLAAIVWELRTRPPLATVVAVAIPVSLVAAPYIWSYDHSVLLVSVAVVIAAIAGRPPSVRLAFLVLLVVAAVLVPWMLYSIAFRRGDEAWSVVVPLAMLAVVALASRGGTRVPVAKPLADGYGTMPS